MAKKAILEEVRFRPIEGAHSISTTEHKTPRGGQGGGPDFDYEREEKVHPTEAHAVAHLKTVFAAGPSGEPKADKSEATEQEAPE